MCLFFYGLYDAKKLSFLHFLVMKIKSKVFGTKLADNRYVKMEIYESTSWYFENIGDTLEIGLIAHKSRRYVNDWVRKCKSYNLVTTGKNLLVFTWVFQQIKEIIKYAHEQNKVCIAISGADEKRFRVYCKLFKKLDRSLYQKAWFTENTLHVLL